jgi:ferredoxin
VALIGVRPCDLAGIARLDQVFLEGPFRDPIYAARRSALLVIVANCTEPAGTCFCASMGTGPSAGAGCDLAFTELPADDHGPHRLLFTAGSNEGGRLLAALPGRAPLAADRDAERQLLDRAATRMGRAVETAGLAPALTAVAEHPEWNDVAHRCLGCANCTMVCPTCFCSTVEDHSTLSGREVERRRRWDSCFTAEFSYIHGGSIRPSTRARYRQWLTHKFATSVEQFGQPSCVGCGRCITWCPGGIDATEEIRRLRSHG